MDPQLITVLIILLITISLIITEILRIDLVAIMAMLALVWTGSITPEEARSGFSSNAVMAIIAVMIMGRGLHRAGVTDQIADFILRVAGKGRRKIISTVSLTVGVMSGFLQNIGAAALFLPVMMKISKKEKVPISGLLMPMGFAALLGGTMTMVGTSSLIVLNDLLGSRGIEKFSLFTVTPIGLTLLTMGILYFFFLGPSLLPARAEKQTDGSSGKRLLEVWGLSDTIFTFRIPKNSPLIGKNIQESEMGSLYNLNLLRVYGHGKEYDIWEAHEFKVGQKIVVQGKQEAVGKFAQHNKLNLTEAGRKAPTDDTHGYLELVIPAHSNLVGKTIRDVALRETYNAQVVLFFSDSQVVEEGMADREVQPGDTLILYGKWDNLQFFEESEDFITVTPFPHQRKKPEKAWIAVTSFVGAIALIMLVDLSISLGFLTGAVAMILGGILTIEDAYRAIEWKVIFLISGLIPIGIAMENSGAATLLANSLLTAIEGTHPFVILFGLGMMTSTLALVMSNVAATVLMIPLVLEMAGVGGLTPQVLALQVGICAANCFMIPTHHVNALLMTPGGYQVSDYLKAGSILSLLFISVSTSLLYFFYL